MSRKGKNKRPESRRREEDADFAPADRGKVPCAAPGSVAGEDAPPAGSVAAWNWFLAVALVVVVFLVYQPAWRGGFLWDDENHLLNNPVLKPWGLAKVWVPGGYLNYWPLTFTAYWLEFSIWGLNPLGFHLVNIAVHALSSLLLWRILVQLRVHGALFAAAIFALHPVNVESVAWIAQLKGVLSLMLALLSVLVFVAHERQGKWRQSALAIGAFALSTLAKGMVITLPLVLLACAWWQRGRIQRRDLLCVLPYLLIGAIMTATEVWTQHLVGADTAVRSDSLLSRAVVAGCAVWFYLGKLIWPLDLCFVYPRWQIDDRNLLSYLPGLLLVVMLALAWWRRRTWGRPIVMLIVCYVGLLLPALGFVNVYFMLYSLVADHYQYAAMIVPCTVFAGVVATLAQWRDVGQVANLPPGTLGTVYSQSAGGRQIGNLPHAGHVMSLVLLAILAALTWRQSRMYADSETLYRTTIDRNPDCWLAHNNLGNVLADRGRIDEAIVHYRKALESNPRYAEAHYNLGLKLAGRG